MLRASLGLGLLLAGAAAGVEVRVTFTKSRGNNPDGLSLSEVRFLHEAIKPHTDHRDTSSQRVIHTLPRPI